MDEQKKNGTTRRSFFARLAAGAAGGVALGSILPNILRAAQRTIKKTEGVNVSINPLAVPRTSIENKGPKFNG